MKIIGNIASIKKDSNRLISTTFADWSAIREGTFIKFDDDQNFYIASHVEKRTFLKDFIVIEPHIIQINEDCGTNINEDDNLVISFKEYELITVYKIISAGKHYRVGDKLTLNGGAASLNITDNTLHSSAVLVTRVGDQGEILEIQIENRGKYLVPPNSITELKGGFGVGASVEAGYKLTDHRSFIEKDVEKIDFKHSETILRLFYSLPPGIKEGKLSIEKWEIVLTNNYVGATKIKQPFQIIRDFTPNLRIPLLAPNSPNQELIFNNALTILDRKIAELEKKIKNN